MSIYGKFFEFLAKNSTKNVPKSPALQKEQRGLYNTTYNDKNAVFIKRDLENADYLAKMTRGYHNHKSGGGKGAKHIQLRHTLNNNQEGFVTPQEIANMGKSMREYLAKHKPFEEVDKQGRKSFIYEWENKEGVRFRAVTKNEKLPSGEQTSPALSSSNEIITFYSDRNLKNGSKMRYKNPLLQKDDEKKGLNPALFVLFAPSFIDDELLPTERY